MLPSLTETGRTVRVELPVRRRGVNVVESLPSGESLIWQTVRPHNTRQKQQLTEHFGSAAREIPIAIEGSSSSPKTIQPIDDLSVDRLSAI